VVADTPFTAEPEWFLEWHEPVVSLDAVLDGDDIHADVESPPAISTCLFLLHGGNQRADVF